MDRETLELRQRYLIERLKHWRSEEIALLSEHLHEVALLIATNQRR
jgi:hypothetical protein